MGSYKPTEKEILILDKFSCINEKMFIESDRISVIDGKIDNSGNISSISKMAFVKLDNPHNFDKKIGFFNIKKLLQLLKTIKNYDLKIYDTYVDVIDLDNKFTIKIYLTPEEKNLIPCVDSESKFNKIYTMADSARFSIDWSVMTNLIKNQKILNKKYIYVYSKKDNSISVKVADDFTANSDSAEIEINGNIEFINLNAMKNGKFIRFELNIEMFVEDTYEITVLEKAILFKGLNSGVKYMILTLLDKTN